MIYVKALIKGEDDIPPFTRHFEYADETDESIFFEAIEMIRQRLSKNLRINIHECLMIYLAYVVEQLRANKPIKSIKGNARKVLSVDQVMIGVPECLKKITFEIRIDNNNNSVRKEMINIDCPFPPCKYVLLPQG
jgi:urease gamma subunit